MSFRERVCQKTTIKKVTAADQSHAAQGEASESIFHNLLTLGIFKLSKYGGFSLKLSQLLQPGEKHNSCAVDTTAEES